MNRRPEPASWLDNTSEMLTSVPSPHHPDRGAFTRIELLVLVASFVLLVVLLVPSIARARRSVRGQACTKNLKQVGMAFRTWTGSGDGAYSTQSSTNFGGTKELVENGTVFILFQAMSNELLGAPAFLLCPLDTDKSAATNFGAGLSDSNVSYFISVDGRDTFPHMFLAGDRNLTASGVAVKHGVLRLSSNSAPLGWTGELHRRCGNVLFADGLVQRLDGGELTSAVTNQWCDTNRLIIP